MINTVYVVTAGEYSYYHIERIFSSEALAEEYVAAYNHRHGFEPGAYGAARVETYDVDSTTVRYGDVLRLSWFVSRIDGSPVTRSQVWAEAVPSRPIVGRDPNTFGVFVMCDPAHEDLGHKALQDAVATLKAEREGIA